MQSDRLGMAEKDVHAVTGAYGFSREYIARRSMARGRRVITLTDSVHRRNPFGDTVPAFPFHFDEPGEIEKSLKGVKVHYNTYWVRFNTKTFNYDSALTNLGTLLMQQRAPESKKLFISASPILQRTRRSDISKEKQDGKGL